MTAPMPLTATTPTRRPALALSIPRQHGAWSILLASCLLGVASVDAQAAPALLLLVAVVAGFVARHAVVTAVRLDRADDRKLGVWGWAAGYALAAGVAVATLLLVYDRWRLVGLGIAAAHFIGFQTALERKRLDRTLLGELLGVLGLTLVVPAAAYVSSGVLSAKTFALWFLALAFFGGAVFHVRYLVRAKSERAGAFAQRLRAGWATVAFHTVTLGAAAALVALRLLPAFAPVALLPAVARALAPVALRADAPLRIRQIGFAEVAHTVVFVTLAILAYRLGT